MEQDAQPEAETPALAPSTDTRREITLATAYVRAAVPAADLWRYDRGTYEGMTAAGLRTLDRAVDHVQFRKLTRGSYCMEATALGRWAHVNGPNGKITSGRCR